MLVNRILILHEQNVSAVPDIKTPGISDCCLNLPGVDDIRFRFY